MSADNIFGPIVSGHDVEVAVRDTITKWITTYLAEVERHTGREVRSMSPFRSYVHSITLELAAGDQTPGCVIVVADTDEPPKKHGDGSHDATFSVGLAAVVSARDRVSTMALAKAYALALRMILVQQGSLGGFAQSCRWVDEAYDEAPVDPGEQTVAVGMVQFLVVVRSVVSSADGPITVPADPYADPSGWATIRPGGVTSTTEPIE